MKKTSIFTSIVLVIAMGLIATSCRSTPDGPPPDDIPEWLRENQTHLRQQGHRAEWAMATMANPSRARAVAATRARVELATWLAAEASGAVRDEGAGADMDIQAADEAARIVNDVITRQTLVGTYIVHESLNGHTSHVLVKLPRDRIAENLEIARNSAVRQVQADASARVAPDDLALLMGRVIGRFL